VIAAAIDHTNLSPSATAADITALCEEAVVHRFATVCVHPVYVSTAASVLQGSGITVCAVVGFPAGAHPTAIKVSEAAACVADGAGEIDMVAQTGWLRNCDWRGYYDDIATVRNVVGRDLIVKVIIEASLLDETEIVRAGTIAAEAGADFVKTSTGVYGQARLEDVALLRRILPPEIRIKAAGGIRCAKSVREFLEVGADRIGASASVAIMWELAGVAPGS
jgi:deoxyribose-phosphate aldolase